MLAMGNFGLPSMRARRSARGGAPERAGLELLALAPRKERRREPRRHA